MTCLVACLIWIGGLGYEDLCPARVNVVYSTKEYFYVNVEQGPTIVGNSIKMEIKINQRIDRKQCK